jgi:hypothetical protein
MRKVEDAQEGSMKFNYGADKKCQEHKTQTDRRACSGGLKDIMRDITREIS